MEEKIPRNCNWIICKDLNMVECHENKSSMCGKLTLEKEKLFLELLKLFIGIQEPTRIERGLKYSWNN
jgi:hypothetical protein